MLLYVSKAFEDNIGATMHYRALKEIYGEKNIIAIDLRPISVPSSENYISYGKFKNQADRIQRWLQGNMMFISNKIINELCDIIAERNIKIVFIEDSVFGNLVKKIKSKFPQVMVVSFFHDIKADLYPQWRRREKYLWHRIDPTIGITQEKISQKYTDVNIVFNQRDSELYTKYYNSYPEGKLPLPAPIPNIPTAYYTMQTSESCSKKILFVGKKYYPNLVGLKWFADNVLPSLGNNIQIDVVGRGLEDLRGEYSDPRINIIGGVDSLEKYYLEADIIIAPLFDGGGMKSKTVEALSYGKLFVGTQESLFGFWEELDSDIQNKTVYKADTAEDWIKILNRLAGETISKFYGTEYDVFKDKFSYEAVRDSLKELLNTQYQKLGE